MKTGTRIVVIGDTHNAWVTGYCLACLGHAVTLASDSKDPQIKECGPEDLKTAGVELVAPEWALFDVADGMTEERFALSGRRFDFAWVAHDTPLDKSGAPDVSPIARMLAAARYVSDNLVISSQVPLGFCESHVMGFPLFQKSCPPRTVTSGCQCPTCSEYRGYRKWDIAYVPENMRIGDGVEMFLNPDRIVVGATTLEYGGKVAKLLDAIPARADRYRTNLATAEMIKHATNAFLATSISLANELAEIGRPYEVDMNLVTHALRSDSRIGPKAYVEAGRPFTGGTLKRDLRALQQATPGYQPRPLIDAVLSVNDVTKVTCDCTHGSMGGPCAMCHHPHPIGERCT